VEQSIKDLELSNRRKGMAKSTQSKLNAIKEKRAKSKKAMLALEKGIRKQQNIRAGIPVSESEAEEESIVPEEKPKKKVLKKKKKTTQPEPEVKVVEVEPEPEPEPEPNVPSKQLEGIKSKYRKATPQLSETDSLHYAATLPMGGSGSEKPILSSSTDSEKKAIDSGAGRSF